MDFKDDLCAFSRKIPAIAENIKTEEATKTALVMPFIQLLGYNVFDPTEVCPEFIADVGHWTDGGVVVGLECRQSHPLYYSIMSLSGNISN